MKQYDLTDMGNAQRFAFLFGKHVRWVEAWGSWVVWDPQGGLWRKSSAKVRRLAFMTVNLIAQEAGESPSENQREALLKWARRSDSVGGVRDLLSAAQARDELQACPEDFDTDPWLFPVSNYVIDLRTQTAREHRPEDMNTFVSPVVYDLRATCPRFDAFLQECHPGKPEVQRLLLQLAGYSLTGVVRDHILEYHWGSGRNGKGTFDRVRKRILGSWGITLKPSFFVQSRNEGHATKYMSLRGRRFASTPDMEEGAVLASGEVNRLTGGDNVRGNLMFTNEEEFRPTHKLAILANPKLVVKDPHDGIWERLLLIEWGVNFALMGTLDTSLEEKLNAELSGILNRFLEGLKDWLDNGLVVPEPVKMATKAYRKESDPIEQFLSGFERLDRFHASLSRVPSPEPSHQAFAQEFYARNHERSPLAQGGPL